MAIESCVVVPDRSGVGESGRGTGAGRQRVERVEEREDDQKKKSEPLFFSLVELALPLQFLPSLQTATPACGSLSSKFQVQTMVSIPVLKLSEYKRTWAWVSGAACELLLAKGM